MTHSLPPTVDVRRASVLLHLHPHTVDSWARIGKIPAHKIGRRWLFLTEELLAWVGDQPGCKCPYTSAGRSTGYTSPLRAARRLENLLTPVTRRRPRNTTTAGLPNCGALAGSASVLELHLRKPPRTG